MSAASPARDPFDAALATLEADGLIAFPTETVWGIGADARSHRAVAALRAWKGGEQPISLLVEGDAALFELGFRPTEALRRLLARFWPGPLTVVLRHPEPGSFAPGIAGPGGTIGLRCSPHPIAAGLAARARGAGIGPLTATSLNRHGAEPARTRSEAMALVGSGPDAPQIVDQAGPDAGGAEPSTVLDCSGDRPRVLRVGALAREALAPWLDAEATR